MSETDRRLNAAETADLERLLWFARTVREMRRCQRDYFTARKAGLTGVPELQRSRDLERRVDEAVVLLLDPRQAVLPLGGSHNYDPR
jgi:hypothetical protein